MAGKGKKGPPKGYKPKEGVNTGNMGLGRPKGTPNKSTTLAREAIAIFVDQNSEKLQGWLDAIAEQDGPMAAFRCLMDVMEYHVPKLARTEHVGEDGGAIQHEISIQITPVKPLDTIENA